MAGRYIIEDKPNEFTGLTREAVTDPLKVTVGALAIAAFDEYALRGTMIGDVAIWTAGAGAVVTACTCLVKLVKDNFTVDHGQSNELLLPVLRLKEKENPDV